MTTALTSKAQTGVLPAADYNRFNVKGTKSGIAGIVLFGCLVVAGFLGGSVYWAASTKLDGAVVAPAFFVVEGNRKTVEHLDGGIVRNILVGNGDLVEAGQTLIELDSTELGVNVDVIESQIADLAARRARLLANLAGATKFDRTDVERALRVSVTPALYQDGFATQKLLFDAEKRSRDAELMLTQQRIKNLEDQIVGLADQRASNARQQAIVSAEVKNLQSLLNQGLIAAGRVNARRIEIERLTGTAAALLTQEAQARNQISELQLSSIGSQTLREEAASNELAQIDAALATLEPQFVGARERLKRVAITAPVSGRVVEMTVFTSGGVVRPGAALLDIVPEDAALIVEARVNPSDIDKLFAGQSSRVRLSAFDLAEVPEAQGEIVDISADSIEDDRTGEPYYQVRVKLSDAPSAEIAALDLVAGMPADVFVNTGERTALSYLTQPIMGRLARTFIE